MRGFFWGKKLVSSCDMAKNGGLWYSSTQFDISLALIEFIRQLIKHYLDFLWMQSMNHRWLKNHIAKQYRNRGTRENDKKKVLLRSSLGHTCFSLAMLAS